VIDDLGGTGLVKEVVIKAWVKAKGLVGSLCLVKKELTPVRGAYSVGSAMKDQKRVIKEVSGFAELPGRPKNFVTRPHRNPIVVDKGISQEICYHLWILRESLGAKPHDSGPWEE
jgi:hypothetical protein